MVKTILKEERVDVPENVTVSVKSKIVTVKGALGELTRSFQKVPV
jgi:ribosomal protein L6P/L9E